MIFDLKSKFNPAGDQPEAIKNLCDGINSNIDYQTTRCYWIRKNFYNS